MKIYFLLVCITLIPVSLAKMTHQLIIPESTSFPHAKLLGTIDHTLYEYTLCYWSRYSADSGDGTVLSYSTKQSFNLWSQTDSKGYIYHYRKKLSSMYISTGSTDAQWFHTCVVGSTFLNEKWRLFLNGVQAWIKKEESKEDPIPPNGRVVLGQDWREYEKKFGTEKFHGRIADVFMWDRVLSAQEIAAVYKCINTETANVINWNLQTWRLFDGVRISYADLPCGK